MRKSIWTAGMALAVLLSCNSGVNRTRGFIAGTYVRGVKGEFGRAADTLVIADKGNNTWSILRCTAYRVIRNGRMLPLQHRSEMLMATFDEQRGVLLELGKGRQFSFDPGKGLLIVNGKGVYTKL